MDEEPRRTFINGSMSLKKKDMYLKFLNQNWDVFAWTYSEILWLDPTVTTLPNDRIGIVSP